MKFGPFNGAYPGHKKDMQLADLDPSVNKWEAVYDFNDPAHAGENWRILEPDEQDPMWCPMGKSEPCLIPMQDSSANLFERTPAEHSSDDNRQEKLDRATPSTEEESGLFHTIKVFGHRAWTIISQTACSIQTFCTGLIFSGMQIPNKMLSSGR